MSSESGSVPDFDLERLRHAAYARLAALGHLAVVRPDHGDPVPNGRTMFRCIALRAHRRVHCGAIRIGRSVSSDRIPDVPTVELGFPDLVMPQWY